MTVEELIEALKQRNPKAIVLIGTTIGTTIGTIYYNWEATSIEDVKETDHVIIE